MTQVPHDPKTMPHEDPEAGAVLLPPRPPPPGTVRMLIPHGCTWSARQVPHAVQIDVVLAPAKGGA